MNPMTEPSPDKRAARGQATRDQLIEVATGLFAERGYEDTSIEAVLAAAGVSRGALYHHFTGKDALFEAVLESVEARITAQMNEATMDAPDAVTMLRTGALAWIEMAADPVIQRVVLVDAPSVLGWERWRALNEQNALGAARALFQAVAADGYLPLEVADAFAHMMMAALDEMALVIARADDPAAARAEGRAAVEELLRRLLRQ